MEKLESIPTDLTFHSWAEAMKFASDYLPHSCNFNSICFYFIFILSISFNYF